MAAKKKSVSKKVAKKRATTKKAAHNKVKEKKAVKKKVAAKKTAVVSKPVAGLKTLEFPVVGIGASAGGLEAIGGLLKYLPSDIGMAFVLVQHLAPEHKSMMAELLTQETRLKVAEIQDGMPVEPDHFYVIPPNTNLAILNNTLHLMPRETGKHHLPIDYFFQTLAEDQGNNAIGIILSGSASDGTLGLKAIKAGNGVTMAQDSETARYDSMPESAIAAGCVDFVLNPEGMVRELVHIARHPEVMHADIVATREEEGPPSKDLDKVFVLLRNRTGNDFTYYKHTTIRRRIARRMLVHKIERLKDYVRYLSSHPVEVDALFHDILINVTSFFRDPDAFEALKTEVFPAMMQEHPMERPIRIWIPGCSTGEEVYSIIICLLEYLGENARGKLIQIFASDIDPLAIENARAGIYPEGIIADVSKDRLHRFCSPVPQGYQINKSIRDICVFAQQNIVKDPPFSHQDLIACRNMLIYMNTVLQRKVLQTLHYALNPNGFLFLGNSESVGSSADLFTMAVPENKIYKRKETLRPHYQQALTATPLPALTAPVEQPLAQPQPLDLQRRAESVILNLYAPPGIVVNDRLDVLQFVGHTGPYMDPTPGAASLNLIKLAHPDLSVELRVLAHHAMGDNIAVRKEGVRLRHNGNIQELTIEILPLEERGDAESFYLVLFRKETEYPVGKSADAKRKSDKQTVSDKELNHIQELERELAESKAYLQSIIEEQEASNEELQSANEEIQSTNEELQSTNEELETAKEELQSTNEELITVNEELENRNIELSTSNDDLHNLIASTELPLIMLNEALKIRFISPRAYKLLNLIVSDLGRSISDIRTNLDVEDLGKYVRKVLDTLKPISKDIRDNKGHWYTTRIRPYRTQDNRIKGAVIVFIDITETKSNLQRASRLATVVEDAYDAITVLDFEGRILAWNRRAQEIYGFSEDEALNATIGIILPEPQSREMKRKMEQLYSGKKVEPFKAVRQTKQGGEIKVLVTMSLLRDAKGQPETIATTEHLIEN